ncbi:DUF1214 domain-containing protein [Pararhizobium mangrovi]|uniref:DUF1214 domain-containing protein n=1 Tax=Pararhizobium mangrovi TaxID=2590452 RepID=A0A506UI48_9HYPH|nr:DUF1214 domain-containing protein [Pararhizobium mangrovi]
MRTLRLPLLVVLALAIAFYGGIASSLYAFDHVRQFESVTVGPWSAWPDLQTGRVDPYARAYRARKADLLLGEAEGVVFTAKTDDQGRALSGTCSYVISGTTPRARFWTLRATSADGAPIGGNPALPHAFQSQDVLGDGHGGMRIAAAPTARPGNWLAIRHAGRIHFVLTLYDTPAAGNAGIIDLKMPSIERTGCGDA